MTTPQPDPRRWKALAVCLIAGFMTLLDVSIVNVALPAMQRSLGASSAELSWVVSGYALTFGLVLVASGRLGDDRGRKKMFIISLTLFTLTSAAAGAAQDPTWLVILRLLQGAAGGMLNPQIIGFIQQLFAGRERGRAFGLFGAAIGVSTAVGPLLGGLLLQWGGDANGWRWVFLVNIPIGIVALVLGVRLLPRDPRPEEREGARPLDLVGAVLLGITVVALMYPLVLAERDFAGAPWWLLAVAVLALLAFVAWERRARRSHGHPLVDFQLLRTRSYALGTSLGLLYFAGFTAIFFVLTLFLQQGRGYTPLEAGLALTPFALGSAATSAIGGRLVGRLGKPLVVGGLLLVALGLVATDFVLRLDPEQVGWAVALPLLVAGLGSGFVIAPNQTLALEEIPPREGGTAAGVLQTGQRVGSAVGISLVGAVFFGQLTSTRGDWASAISLGLLGAVGLVVLALLLGIADLVFSHRAARTPRPALPVAPQALGAPHGSRAGSHDHEHPGDRPDDRADEPGDRTDRHADGDGWGSGDTADIGSDGRGNGHDPATRTAPTRTAPTRTATTAAPASVTPVVRGRVLRGEDGRPLAGAVLTLVDPTGHQSARAETDAGGAFRLEVGGPGFHQLVARSRGRAPEVTWVAVGRGDVVRDVILPEPSGRHGRPIVTPGAD